MSFDTFEALTPEEFTSAYKAWSDRETGKARDSWNRLRTLAAIEIRPHIKNAISPEKLLPLPWDKKAAAATGHTGERSTAARVQQLVNEMK